MQRNRAHSVWHEHDWRQLRLDKQLILFIKCHLDDNLKLMRKVKATLLLRVLNFQRIRKEG
jgi:hypothetical protein